MLSPSVRSPPPRKYPIKEPFVELMKGSLNTFLNAFTYPDRTCYPVASTNTQDFYNLVDVYLDAVLHPRCINDPQTFQQEGWHLELDDTKDPLTYKGVVFNEMKGVYSSPDSMFYRYRGAKGRGTGVGGGVGGIGWGKIGRGGIGRGRVGKNR
jgi:Zn-dependent M16 (insulinase) family peptidase